MLFSDVNVAFQQAAHKVLLDDDNLLPLLHLTVDYQGKDGKGEFLLCGHVFWRCREDGERGLLWCLLPTRSLHDVKMQVTEADC